MNPFGLGAVKSPEDKRDLPASAVLSASPLPSSFFVDISSLPVWNQKKNGSCVGHASAKYAQLLNLKETGEVKDLSARFLYAYAKARDGFPGEGTFPRLVASIAKDVGVATETTVPNNCDLTHEEYVYFRQLGNLPTSSIQDAAPYKIGGYAFVDVRNEEEMKRAIVEKHGAILLMRIGEEWWTPSYSPQDIIPLEPPRNIVSGHEVYLYGYETIAGRTRFHILNSWSPNWADSGKAWFWHDEYRPFLDEAITFTDIPNTIHSQLSELPKKEDFHHVFGISLKKGMKGEEVVKLQTALLFEGVFSSDLYVELLKSDSLGYYGDVTAKAVLAFQLKNSVAPLGELLQLRGEYLGPKTRAKLSQIYSL